jgi:hypothetical protein
VLLGAVVCADVAVELAPGGVIGANVVEPPMFVLAALVLFGKGVSGWRLSFEFAAVESAAAF